ncbi:MAG TPA: hypothetical protein VJ842_06305 [Pyrinomonadaceae bacterium]|nr:hypothetical protein [Pyrinomonadaceae bacterium]
MPGRCALVAACVLRPGAATYHTRAFRITGRTPVVFRIRHRACDQINSSSRARRMRKTTRSDYVI